MAENLVYTNIESELSSSNELLLDCKGTLSIEIPRSQESPDSIVFCCDVPLPEIHIKLYNGTKRRCILSLHDVINVHTQKPAYKYHQIGNFKVELNNDTIEAIGNYITNLYVRSWEHIELFDDNNDKYDDTDLRICMKLHHNDTPIYRRSYKFDRDIDCKLPVSEWLRDLYTIFMYFEV